MEKDKKKNQVCGEKSIRALMPWRTPADDSTEDFPLDHFVLVAQAWSVIQTNKRCVLCSLYLSLVWMHRLKN